MLRGRYAPSPTGYLHLGNARTALLAWWQARSQSGQFVMRVEDLDMQRSKPDMITANLEELRWLGLDWDEGPDVGGPYAPYLQSRRDHLYEAALGRLKRNGHLFDCYLSRKDLREVATAPHGQAAVYGERERKLNERLKSQKLEKGKLPSWRFRVEADIVSFEDGLAGRQELAASSQIGDFVVRRADEQWAYQLAVVVDDIAMNISDVVRGDDLLASTGAQLLLYQALGARPPQFTHVPLLLDSSGERMAKRKGSLTLTALRNAGIRPERVVGLLAYSLGMLETPQEISARELLSHFDPATLSHSPYRLTADKLAWLGIADG